MSGLEVRTYDGPATFYDLDNNSFPVEVSMSSRRPGEEYHWSTSGHMTTNDWTAFLPSFNDHKVGLFKLVLGTGQELEIAFSAPTPNPTFISNTVLD